MDKAERHKDRYICLWWWYSPDFFKFHFKKETESREGSATSSNLAKRCENAARIIKENMERANVNATVVLWELCEQL